MFLKFKKVNTFSFFFFRGFFVCVLGIFLSTDLLSYPEDLVQVQILSSSTHLGQESSCLFGLEVTLKEGWHIYAPQKDPSMMPPTFEKNTSFNMNNFRVFWPPPLKISIEGGETLIYSQKTIIPFMASIPDPSQEAVLKTTLKLVACNNSQCVPLTQDLFFTLSPGPSTPTPEAPLLKTLLKNASLDFPEPLSSLDGSFLSLLTLLGSAFLGGLILNFMPCVLPVLSLKFLSVLKKRSSPAHLMPSHLKIRFLMSFLGILTFFFGFGLISSLAHFFGGHIGWGFQFQNPYFLSGMILILLLFSMNLWGFFEINLPSFLLDWISRKKGLPQKDETPKNTLSFFASDYASGLFAAFLATPCTAPFLSVALGASLTQTPFHIFLTFLSIGTGFGLPYLLMIFYPQALLKLPSPGPWMKTFKRTLSLGLIGTALWLTFVLVLPNFSVLENDSSWISFSPQSLETHLQKGDSVLVDVTAEWCLTCKMNKFRVYQKSSLKRLFKERGIILMRADWTRSNPEIEHYLKSFKRTAIPFTVYYTPQHPNGRILPELLTPSFLTDLIQETP
ncbi:MAG: hypothetical protein B7Y25_00990 [Alphaproteobacteria bacterium 16-39-46]|nr:MAG: hypothetical protein B7Y25_00990 [Alphaproteobacteria bacterium 16-39-46]OZA44200.1 MAG: hypothetical protein B7X84_01070 [Alphaproteobacteria bacterium 17-39-52]HQS83672.1 thioredoxin family protein [Alphaproteobacteria bacterium]HQS93416.1 thioredoxin family protein [Alphaproteobacteria bacterium]